MLNAQDEVLKFMCWRAPKDEVEERIHGEDGEVELANKWMCARCGEIFMNLEDIGYCLDPTENMHKLLREYHLLTGFVAPQHPEAVPAA